MAVAVGFGVVRGGGGDPAVSPSQRSGGPLTKTVAGGAGEARCSQPQPRYSVHTPFTVTVAVVGQAGFAPGTVEVTAAGVAAGIRGQTMSQMGMGQRLSTVVVWV